LRRRGVFGQRDAPPATLARLGGQRRGADRVGEALQQPPAERPGGQRIRHLVDFDFAAISIRSGQTVNRHLSVAPRAASRTSTAQASSIAIRKSAIESRSKSARPARSAATTRIVGIATVVLAVVCNSTTTTKSSRGPGGRAPSPEIKQHLCTEVTVIAAHPWWRRLVRRSRLQQPSSSPSLSGHGGVGSGSQPQ
jgi:hypothetical protein